MYSCPSQWGTCNIKWCYYLIADVIYYQWHRTNVMKNVFGQTFWLHGDVKARVANKNVLRKMQIFYCPNSVVCNMPYVHSQLKLPMSRIICSASMRNRLIRSYTSILLLCINFIFLFRSRNTITFSISTSVTLNPSISLSNWLRIFVIDGHIAKFRSLFTWFVPLEDGRKQGNKMSPSVQLD